MNVKRSWRRVDGVLLLDKPAGITSNAALQNARRLFSAAKAGHTGTLDPLASGLLPLCFGEATKFSADLLEADKSYDADLLFGITTDTGDAEGAVRERRPVGFTEADLRATLARFRGSLQQTPPMYSALKRDGKPLYELARQGIEVERTARDVTIRELSLLDFTIDRCRLRVTCSKGTYIRTLAEDIGAALGCGAHLTALRRTAVGDLQIADAVTLAQLTVLSDQQRHVYLRPLDSLLQTLPAIDLDAAAAMCFTHGNPVPVQHTVNPGKRCRVYDTEDDKRRLLGLGEINASGKLQPRRLICF